MSGWHTGRLALFDLETTGVDPHRDRIVTAAVIGAGAGPTNTHEWLLDPGIDIPEGAAEVHGITTEHARKHGVDPAPVVAEMAQLLIAAAVNDVPVVGHNVVYDLTMLWAELVRHGHDTLAKHILVIEPVVDTAVIEKHLDPFRPGQPNGRRPDDACGSHRLVDCARLWGIPLTEEDAHGAAADALAAGRLAWRLATDPYRFEQYDGRPVERIHPGQWPLEQLHRWQVTEKARQAASLEKHFRKTDPDAVVDGSWPVQPPPADWSPDQPPAPREVVPA